MANPVPSVTCSSYLHLTMEGYTRLASLMGACPEVAILRRFGSLNARNLLYIQAELVALEGSLQACTEGNNASNDSDRVASARDWYTLSRLGSSSNNSSDVDAGEEWRTMLEIREKLKEYSLWLSSNECERCVGTH